MDLKEPLLVTILCWNTLLLCNWYKKSLCSDKHVATICFVCRKCTVAAAVCQYKYYTPCIGNKGNFCEAILLVYWTIEAFLLYQIFQNLKGFTLIYNFMLKQKLLKGKRPQR